jgi:hypothetical protein
MSGNKHLLLAGSASESHTACAAGIVARSRNAESAEPSVIVLSILLAFWIEASWDLRGERNVALEHLAAVRDEVIENVSVLGESTERCQDPAGAAQAIRHLLTLMGPEPTVIPGDSLIRLVARGVAGEAPLLRTSAFDAMVSSGALAQVASLSLQQELRRWRALVDQRRARAQFISDEIVKTLDYLVAIGASPRIADASRVDLPRSRFPLDVQEFLSDPIFAGTIGMLGIRRDQVCIDDEGRRQEAQDLVDFLSVTLEG